MKNRNVLQLALTAVVLCNLSLVAQAEVGKVDVKGKVWTQFSYNATKAAPHYLGFNIYRFHVAPKYEFDDKWSTMGIIEATTDKKSTATSFQPTVRIYNAFIDKKSTLCDGDLIRIGLQPTLYIDHINGQMKTRWIAKTLADESSVIQSQSGGASYGSSSDSFKYSAMLHNGNEGITTPGNDDGGIAASLFAGFTPAKGDWGSAGLALGFDYQNASSKSQNSATATPSKGSIEIAASTQMSIVDAAFEIAYVKANGVSGTGYGPTLHFHIGDNLGLFGRAFFGNTNFQTSNIKAKSVITVGPTYMVMKDKISIGALYETRADKSGGNAAQDISAKFAANF